MGGHQKSTEKRFEGDLAGAAAEQLPRCQLQAAQLGMILCGSSVVGGGGSCTLLLAAAGLDTGRVNSHTRVELSQEAHTATQRIVPHWDGLIQESHTITALGAMRIVLDLLLRAHHTRKKGNI